MIFTSGKLGMGCFAIHVIQFRDLMRVVESVFRVFVGKCPILKCWFVWRCVDGEIGSVHSM